MFNERICQIDIELQELTKTRKEFADEKRRLTLILSKIRNEFRVSGYLPDGQYKKLVSRQNSYKERLYEAEGELAEINQKLKNLNFEKATLRKALPKDENSMVLNHYKKCVGRLQSKYEEISNDPSRKESIRDFARLIAQDCEAIWRTAAH